ncbi:MAG: DNA gyrase inhibitor YacG [Casimicrobiaceae bacterium]
MTALKTVACPRCGTAVAWSDASRWRPFCSERCKLIDLGAWASERYRVPVAERPDDDLEGGGEGSAPPRAG